MNTPTVDREFLQEVLANAFAVQESHIGAPSLAAIVEIQQLLMAGQVDQEGAMRRLADCARQVSNAAGVAIGLLDGDQLVYRAGSGNAVACPGRRVSATLVASQALRRTREILRVENAQTSKSVEGAVCRQFSAQALLILPIYQDSATAGVMEVHFSEAHVFLEHEVRTYRLMAGLVGEAMTRAAHGEVAGHVAIVPPAIEHLAFQIKHNPATDRSAPKPVPQMIDSVTGAAVKTDEMVIFNRPRAQTATSRRQQRGGFSRMSFLAGLEMPAVAAVLIVVFWFAYSVGRPVLTKEPLAQVRSSAVDQQPTAASAQVAQGNTISKLQISAATIERAKTTPTKFRRVPVGNIEVDYVADDVTIRHFAPKPSPRGTREPDRVEVRDDVTVRHFPVKPTLAPSAKSSPGAGQAASASLPASAKTDVSKPAR